MTFDYENYILNQLNICKSILGFDDFDIKISSERSFRLPSDVDTGKTLLFILKRLTGSYVYNIKSQPIQIICYSELNTMTVALQILDLFTKQHNNESFSIDSDLIKQNYDTVVSLRPMLQSENGFRASLYVYGNYTICEDLNDIGELSYIESDEAEPINYTSFSMAYSAVLNTTKISGQEISTSMKQEAGVVATMAVLSDNSQFCSKMNAIMLGDESGNTTIKLRFTLNGSVKTIDFKVQTVTLQTSKSAAPALQITLTR